MRAKTIFFYLFVSWLIPACHQSTSNTNSRNGNFPFDSHAELILTKHARCRMDCRHITLNEIHEVLNTGTLNESKSEPDAKPDPKYAVEGFTDEHQHLRIIVAPSGQKLVVVTCIELGVEWTCDCN